jgi:TetR/AcrR family transcriptional repressor of nem operon
MSGRPREFDEHAVLETAMDVFWEQGYEATGIAELSERCGIGRQSMYNTFGDKRALFDQALDLYARERIGQLMAMLERPGSPLSNVHALLDTWEESWASEDSRGCLMVNTMAELGDRDSATRSKLDSMVQTVEDGLFRALCRAQEAGELSPDRECRALARTFTITAQGLAVVGKVASSPSYAKDVLDTTRALLK